ncbi:Putative peptidoglycan binding domain-containing protein [Methylobacterium phyllostachyos]|uniref:Putative peptidoglycan binding domain-containing protein n=1 Tax=Methylobacterium phyllostachyos TaxID=582672 RepID=A0A1H0E1U6_9HYPH|nr:peptidoglycan-binding domain-containing protein [Methylobacterium phyllostachyos]SDN76339.1 Putative peptidoglycan binding domain-containing protein [Methylobacterium phyllostachyos]
MSGYREITVPGEAGRPRRPAVRRGTVQGDWRSVLVGALTATGTTCRNSPGTVLGSLVGLAAAGFICVNALGYQAGRHPAPILPKLAQKTPPAREPAPAAQEAAREPVRQIVRDPVRSEPEKAPAKPAARDTIGELIRADETTASVTPKAAPVRVAAKPAAKETAKDSAKGPAKKAEAESDRVLRAQKALSKLGYPVKPDGAMGPGTRAAIEKFERSAKLPVTGEATGRTLRELMARASHG